MRGKVTTSFAATPFEFAEAILSRDRKRAMRALSAMYDRGVQGKDGETVDKGGVFPFVTSWLYTQLAQAIEGRRLLDSGVSLDEETTKMIEFQKTFDASARLIRTADEMMDTVLSLKRM